MEVARTQRIVLRDFGRRDLPQMARWLRGEQEWRRYDGPYYPTPGDEDVAGFLEQLEAKIEAAAWPTPRNKLVVADAKTDELFGSLSRYWISEETLWVAVGIDIYDPNKWGRGLGHEALGHWCDYLFRAAPTWARLDLRTWSGNDRMVRLANRLGFRQEACFRKARIVNGEYYDALGFGVLREEWEARHPDGFEITSP